MSLHTLKIRLPGSWEDAWLYRGYLLAWSTAGEMCWLDLEVLRREVRARYGPHLGFLAEQLALRSERKSSRDFADLVELPEVARALFAPLANQPETVLTVSDGLMNPAAIVPVPGHVLDTHVYGNRVFAATDEGVFETQFSARFPDSDAPLIQLTPHPATSVVAGAGRVAASLGEEGLVSRDVEFGDGEFWWSAAEEENAHLETLAGYSRRVSRSSVHLLNYGDAPAPTFYYANTATRETGPFSERVVTDYRPADTLDTKLLDLITTPNERSGESTADLRVFGNANYRLLARAAGRTHIVDLLPNVRTNVSLRFDPRFAQSEELALDGGVPLSVHGLASGIALESFDSLNLLTPDGIYALEEEQCVQVRTFPHSVRYKDTVAAVCEDHIDLIGFTRFG